ADWTAAREQLVAKALRPAIAAVAAQKFDDAEDAVLGVAVKQFAAGQQLFDSIVAAELQRAEGTHAAADARYAGPRALAIGAVIAALALCGLIALYLNRSVSRPLAAMTAAMGRLAGGDHAVAIVGTERRDEIGAMATAVQVFKDGALAMQALRARQ